MTFFAVAFFLTSAVLAVLVVVLFAAAYESGLAVDGVASKRALSEVTIKGKGPNKVLVVPVYGIISNQPIERYFHRGPSMVDMIKLQFDQAEKDRAVKAIVMHVDSPGGGLTASDIICRRIIEFKKRSNAKIVVCMGDVAASGGYYISAPADRIVAHPTTITGSIGVIMPLVNISELAKRWGIKSDPIKSGKMKDIGSMMRDMLPEERTLLQGIIDQMQDRFVTIVSTYRGLPKKTVAGLADGRIYTGQTAKQLGLVDDVGYMEDAIDIAKKLAGIKQAKLIRYRRQISWIDFLDAMAQAAAQPKQVRLEFGSPTGQRAYCPQYLWAPGLSSQP